MTRAPRALSSHLTRTRLLIVAVIGLLVLGSVAYVAWPRGGPPAPALASATPPRVPIAVSLGRTSSTTAVVDHETTISVHTLGEASIQAIELWAGTERVALEMADSSSPAMHARLSWVPEQAGPTVLVARAIDAMGRVAQSNALRVDVAAADGTASVPRAVLAQDSDALVLPLGLPAVQATVDGCEVTLDVAALDDASGFTVYALPPSGFSFLALASLAADLDETAYQVPSTGGSSTFVIGAFDAAVEVLGPPVTVDVPEACGEDGWTGGVELHDGVVVGGPPVDRGYLYLQQGADAAVRIPAAGAFVDPDEDGSLQFGDLLPALTGTEPLYLEAWGWQGDTLVHMGSGTWTPAQVPSGGGEPGNVAQAGPLIAAGSFTSLDIVVSTTVAGPEPCGKEFCTVDLLVKQSDVIWPTTGNPSPERTLRWSTQLAGVTKVVWQLLPYAPPSTSDLDPPFVIDQGVIEVEPGTTSGDFTIDFADYLGEQVPIVELGDDSLLEGTLDPVFAIPGMAAPSPTPKPAGGGTGFAQIGIGQIVPSALANQGYVRIIPMQGATPTFPSNHVKFDVVPPPDPITIDAPDFIGVNEDAYDVTWSFTPPKGPDSAYARCAVVTGFTESYSPPPGLWPETYAIGDVKCYEAPDDDDGLLDFIEDGFEAFVDLVEDVWEGISDGYEWIQDQIVKAMLIAVPCKQIADDAVCETIARTALSVALASMGIPPTIPDYGAVMNGLKGDLKTLVIEAAKSQVPGVAEACGIAEGAEIATDKLATCEQLVEEAIDEVIEHVEAEVSAAAGGATGKAWPGVIFAPDPRGVYQPPTVTMTLTRTSDPVLPSHCTATASMTSTKTDHTWQELIAGWPKTAKGTVSGQPFLSESFLIPPMEPGESTTRTVWLSDPATWFESQDAWEYWHYYEAIAYPNRAWVLLTAGSSLTFEVSGNCMPASEQGPHVLTESAIN